MKGLWYTEDWVDGIHISLKIKSKLYEEQTPFQFLEVVDTEVWGRALFLDNCIMTTDKDEFIYHEMITHIPMNAHPNPERVLVIGGGDGGVIREVVKYPSVKEAVLCEIDEAVIRAARTYFPQIACGLDDPRVKIIVGDGIKHIVDNKNYYDVIIIDSTDPVGMAEGLFREEFYRHVYDALNENGIFSAQTESPVVYPQIVPHVYHDISKVFPLTREYFGAIPTYPGSLWGFTCGSKNYDPLAVKKEDIKAFDCKYYSPDMHYAAFVMPPYLRDLIDSYKED